MANPSAAEKLASQLGQIYVATVLPLMSGTPVHMSQLAHVQGYYAGIIYATGTPAPTEGAAGDWLVMARHRGRR